MLAKTAEAHRALVVRPGVASYGSARDWATQLGLTDHAATLEKTLAEEKRADHLLSEISQRANAVAATV
jgi:ferritin-like metal-binding protein YciE